MLLRKRSCVDGEYFPCIHLNHFESKKYLNGEIQNGCYPWRTDINCLNIVIRLIRSYIIRNVNGCFCSTVSIITWYTLVSLINHLGSISMLFSFPFLRWTAYKLRIERPIYHCKMEKKKLLHTLWRNSPLPITAMIWINWSGPQ